MKMITSTDTIIIQRLTAVSGGVSNEDKTVIDTSHSMDCEGVVICISLERDAAAVTVFSTGGIARDIPLFLFTDSSDHIILYALSSIHWRLETELY